MIALHIYHTTQYTLEMLLVIGSAQDIYFVVASLKIGKDWLGSVTRSRFAIPPNRTPWWEGQVYPSSLQA